MNILYFETKQNELYYKEFLNSLRKKHTVFVNKTNISVDLIVYGYGWVCDGNLDNALNNKLDNVDNIPSVMILNKEYKNIEKKIQFINQNNIDIVFTPHHKYKEWEVHTNAKFYKLPFAANRDIFKDWKLEKKYDLGFTGNLFNSKYYKSGIMGPEFNNIRERISDELSKDVYNNISMYLNGNSYIHGSDYGKLINSSKIWLCTPSATQLVGTRFYDIMGSCSLLFCKESDVYTDLFEPGVHCVTFKDDLSDFREKLFYYLEHDDERNKIIENAHKLFLNNHTWEHRVDQFIENIREYNRDYLYQGENRNV